MKIVKNVAYYFLPKLIIFGIFDELLSTQNVNVARFARNVECDFFEDFQTLWMNWPSKQALSFKENGRLERLNALGSSLHASYVMQQYPEMYFFKHFFGLFWD